MFCPKELNSNAEIGQTSHPVNNRDDIVSPSHSPQTPPTPPPSPEKNSLECGLAVQSTTELSVSVCSLFLFKFISVRSEPELLI